jgi:ribosomal protein S8
MTILQSFSQTNSATQNNSESVVVPISTVKNALIVLEQRNYYKEQLKIVRDSVTIQGKLITNQDSIITNLKEMNKLQIENFESSKKIIENKDKEIKIFKTKYETERRHKWYSIGGGVFITIIALLI